MTRHERYLKNYPERIGRERRERRRTVAIRKKESLWQKANLNKTIGHYLKTHPPIVPTAPKKKKQSLISRLFKPSV